MHRFIHSQICLVAILASASMALGQVKPPVKPAAKPADKPATTAAAATPEPPKEIYGKSLNEWINNFDAKKCPDPSIRQLAAQVVMYFGTDAARKALPYFKYDDVDGGVRREVAANIGMIGRMILEKPMDAKANQDFARVIATLARLGQDRSSAVKLQAAHALGQCVGQYKSVPGRAPLPEERQAINAMLLAIQDNQSFEVRKAAAFALGHLGLNPGKSPDPFVFNKLGRAAYHDPCREVRVQAVMALNSLGLPTGKDLVEEKQVLQFRLKDPDKTVQIWSRRLLMFLEDQSPNAKPADKDIDALGVYLNDPDTSVRINAVKAFGTLGRHAKPKIGLLTKCLETKDLELKLVTIIALGTIGDVSSPAVPELRKLLSSENPAVKQAATKAIERITNPESREKKKPTDKKK